MAMKWKLRASSPSPQVTRSNSKLKNYTPSTATAIDMPKEVSMKGVCLYERAAIHSSITIITTIDNLYFPNPSGRTFPNVASSHLLLIFSSLYDDDTFERAKYTEGCYRKECSSTSASLG